MANDDKTEKPTGKRKSEARKKGQVAKSTEINGALVLVAGLIAISMQGPSVVNAMAGAMRAMFGMVSRPNEVSSAAGLHGIVSLMLHTMETTALPIGVLCMAGGVLANVAQVGFRPTPYLLKPNFSKLNPMQGAKQIFGKRVAFELGKVLAKVAIVGGAAAMSLIPLITHLGASMGTTPMGLGILLNDGAHSIIERVVIVYLLIAVVDLIHQRRTHSKGMKMSKQEVKDEGRQTDLPPEIKGAIRRRQMMAARARMMAAIPSADVVVTNPTHYAVALKYDGGLPAPIVVAKGKNLVAAQIRRIATENNVPIVPDPPLARSLHAMVQIDRMIPAELFAAVAQVLAFVYKMAGRRRIAA
ncbi:MAG TPA: flagellar biosynthesis protein FlhB [Solirubrobacteraceae bacterium]|jgi:flagellar biosynthetic protein FlhB